MPERYHIFLEEDVAVDPRKYGPIVAPILGITKAEARMSVRKGRGIFLESVAEEHARAVAAELEKDGIRSRVVSREQIPPLPALRRITQLEAGDEGLSYRGDEGLEGVPWEAILVVSAGVVARAEYAELFSNVPFGMIPPIHKLEGTEREIVRENLILKMSAPGPAGEKRRRREEDVFERIEQKYGSKVKVYADVLTADLGLWLRVPMDEMGYSVVAGGVKMGGAWGFQLLVKHFRERCGAALTGMTLKLLEAADIKEHVFPQVEEYTRYTSWAALKRFLWPTADSSSPSPAPPESSTGEGSSNASSGAEPPSTSS